MDADIIRALLQLAARTRLSYSMLATLCGISPSTCRHVLASGEMPKRRAPREAIARFVATNAAAAKREDLRLV